MKSAPEEAGSVRKRFIERVCTQDDLKDAMVNLQQTAGTRIRVEIMKLIAARLNEDTTADRTVTVVPHLAKPVLILKEKYKKRPMAFKEVVSRYKHLLQDKDRNRIYDRGSILQYSISAF
jgi:hypothetical protein